jgi:hypothetical protein
VKTANVESTSTAVATADSASRPQTEAVSGPGGFLAAKKSSRTEYRCGRNHFVRGIERRVKRESDAIRQ